MQGRPGRARRGNPALKGLGRQGNRWKTREEVENEARGEKRGKRWKTREEVEIEALETYFNITIGK